MNTVTVPTVMRSMGIEPDQALATSIGAEVRERFRALTGSAPMKALTHKTVGSGSHFHAVYPTEFQPDIEEVVRRRKAMRAAQRDLFIGGGAAS